MVIQSMRLKTSDQLVVDPPQLKRKWKIDVGRWRCNGIEVVGSLIDARAAVKKQPTQCCDVDENKRKWRWKIDVEEERKRILARVSGKDSSLVSHHDSPDLPLSSNTWGKWLTPSLFRRRISWLCCCFHQKSSGWWTIYSIVGVSNFSGGSIYKLTSSVITIVVTENGFQSLNSTHANPQHLLCHCAEEKLFYTGMYKSGSVYCIIYTCTDSWSHSEKISQ